MLRIAPVTTCILAGVAVLQAADVPGSKDPAFLKRYAGSEIVYSMTRSFDEYPLIVPDPNPKNAGKTTTEMREGAIARLIYRVPAGHTALELLRNYEQSVKAAGFVVASEWTPCQAEGARESEDTLFNAVKSHGFSGNPGNPFWQAYLPPGPDGPFCFFTAKGTNAGQAIALTVAVGEKHNASNPNNLTFNVANAPAVIFKPGDVVVMLDVVTSKALVNNMVEVKAVDMADALANKGFVDLYGIYFDVNKADIKPESIKTLDEVANLLKIDRVLKLEISGHTDSTGDKTRNLQLSETRAQAVVQALVKTYGISAARLQAKGYGDTKSVAPNTTEENRAKNRRVELRKL